VNQVEDFKYEGLYSVVDMHVCYSYAVLARLTICRLTVIGNVSNFSFFLTENRMPDIYTDHLVNHFLGNNLFSL